jgi:hypothetical protein
MTETITKEQFDSFRKHAVDVALIAAKRNNMCEVAQRTLCAAGFADLLPATFQVHVKYGPDRSYESEGHDFDDLERARARAKRARKEGIVRVRRSAAYDLEYRYSNFSLNVTRVSVDDAKERVEKAVKEYQLRKRQAAGEDISYPKVKIVRRVWQDNGRKKSETVEFVK